jgi:hypothetical protein
LPPIVRRTAPIWSRLLSSALLRGMEEELCAYRLAVGF